MKPGVTDVTFSTRATELSEAWAFVMQKLEGHELLNIEMTAQDWRLDDEDEWHDTYLVSVQVRLKETP